MKPLENILVVSLEQAVAAPFCSVRLADSGARVIKIERSEGDFARYYDKDVKGESANFVWLNRGKESLVADIKNKGIINKKISHEALKTLKVDEAGLEQLDRDYLNLVINKFSAGPVGLDTLSTALGEERLTLEDMVEPYLLQQGFICLLYTSDAADE